MNNYGDQVSHDIKIKVCGDVLRDNPIPNEGKELERVYDHEGPWTVTDKSRNLHYLGREPIPTPTVPNFCPPFRTPRMKKDPSRAVPTDYWKGATSGKYCISDKRIGRYHVIVDRRCEDQTRGFRFSVGNHGKGRVSFHVI